MLGFLYFKLLILISIELLLSFVQLYFLLLNLYLNIVLLFFEYFLFYFDNYLLLHTPTSKHANTASVLINSINPYFIEDSQLFKLKIK
jgi:hypothetical protein